MLRRANDCQQVKDADLNYTELRNWTAVQERLARKAHAFPVVADFYMSTAFGTSLQEQTSLTITKTRARGKAFWLIDKVQKKPFGKVLVKRRLDVSDDAALQGWDKEAQVGYLKIGNNRFLSESVMLEALGIGFNVCVFETILWRILICHANAQYGQ